MKCRADIKNAIIEKAVDMYQTKNVKKVTANTLYIDNAAFPRGPQQVFRIADSIAARANKEFGGKVAERVPVLNGQQIVFNPSREVVTAYYLDYLAKASLKEAENQQREDAARAGVEFNEDYLFNNEEIEQEANIFDDMDNLNFTTDVIDYLYQNSSKRLTFTDYAEQVQELSSNLRGMGYNNLDILDKIKCL